MERCRYPKCERIVRDPNKFGLCHVHIDMADFFLWFAEYLRKLDQIASRATPGAPEVRPSGLIVPGSST